MPRFNRLSRYLLPLLAPLVATSFILIACVGDEPVVPGPSLVDGSSTDGNDTGTPITTNTNDSGNTNVDSGGNIDSGASDAKLEAAPLPTCDLQKPFGAGAPVLGINDGTSDNIHAALTSDELTIFFQSTRITPPKTYLFSSTRLSNQQPFPTPTALQNIDDLANPGMIRNPSVSFDGLTIYFDSPKAGAGMGAFHIFTSTRSSLASNFSTQTPLPGDFLQNGSVTHDGNVIYVENLSTGLVGRTQRTGGNFAAPEDLANLGPDTVYSPVSGDDLTLYTAIGSAASLPNSGKNIWVYTRPSTAAAFGTPAEVTSLTTTGEELPSWISVDGCRLYFTRTATAAGSKANIMVATRPL